VGGWGLRWGKIRGKTSWKKGSERLALFSRSLVASRWVLWQFER